MNSKRRTGRLKRWIVAGLLIMTAISILLVDAINVLQ